MPSLQSADDRFGTLLSIVEGGAGVFTGTLAEPSKGEPAYVFNLPRRLLRVNSGLPVQAGMVIRTLAGTVYMVGRHGESEGHRGSLFRMFRLFEASGQFSWKRRGKTLDAITRLEKDTGLVAQPDVWGAYEPGFEMFDRQMRTGFETGRFVTNAAIEKDDVVNDMKVSRVDAQLGLNIVTLG